jgi:hypothetical protein
LYGGVVKYELSYDSARMVATAMPLGRFELEDAVKMTEALVTDERYQRGMDLLFDGSLLDLAPATGVEMQVLAETLSRLSPLIDNPRVAVVGTQEFSFGLGRMIEAYADADAPISVFRSRDEALAWLAT